MREISQAPVEEAPSRREGAFDNPQAFIPGDRRRALATGTSMPDRVRGAAVFADISGFTPLTEALARELGPQRGAEALTANLGRVFHALIEELARYGGHVIYFSGDAITCWIDGDDGARAVACALAMQQTMDRLREVVTPGGTRIPLAMKVAVAVGSARRFVVGDPEIQLIDVLAGRLVDALAIAEQHARKGEVVLDQSALEALAARVAIAEIRLDEESGRSCGVAVRMMESVAAAPVDGVEDALAAEIVAGWLLPAVYERLRTGRGEFLAELRPAYSLFVRFGGIDYDVDDAAIAKLDAFVRRAQRIVTSCGGNLLQLTLGDKGAYLYAVFGSPQAHEDDAARAAAAALELRDLPSDTAATGIRIGIAYGRLRSGTYGHAQRQTFTCLGDAVNLAARLMAKAPPGQIYVEESVRRAAGDSFSWEPLAPVVVKGKADPLTVFALTGSQRRAVRRRAASEGPIVGRARELDAMCARLDEALRGDGRVIGLSGEAGIGKSRLIAEFVGIAERRGARIASGECQSFGTNVAYFAWRDVWSTLFGLDRSAPEADQVGALERELAAIDRAFVARAPLLAGLLDLPIPESELTASFDAKLRKTSLEGLLVECLRTRAGAGPLLLVLEDCHWIDPLSRDLLEVLVRSLPGLPVLVVLAYRPGAGADRGLGIESLPQFAEIGLAELDREQTDMLVRSRLRQMRGAEAAAPAALADLVAERTQGNPFYVEQLLDYIAAQGIDLQDERALAHLELPESLHSLILSRVDRLEEAPRQVLKVASVFGRVFRAAMLPGVYPELGPIDGVRRNLDALDAADLVKLEDPSEQTYVFKHVVTREVAYESMPFAFRSTLHERTGQYIEDADPEAIDRNLDLLAYHYWHGENRDKKREYLGRAGTAAQAAYANATAIDYFERLAPLLSKGSRLEVLLKLGKVLEIVGNWHRAEEVDREALALAEDLDDGHRRASCEVALAEVMRKQGRYTEALEQLNRAARGFAAFGEEGGVAKVAHLVGTVWAQRGEYDKALDSYNKSLRIRERIGDKAGMGSLLSNLGVIAEYRGDYDAAQAFHERALALRESVGDRWAIGVSMANLGMIAVLQKRHAEAREWFEKSMRLNREVGDAWMVANCHNNLGNATRGLGEYDAACAHYAQALRAYRDYDDKWALAFLLEDVGLLAALRGDAASGLELIGAAEAIREAIGAPRAPSLEQELARQLAAAAALPEDERAASLARGRALDLVAAVERAFAVSEKA